MISPPYSFLCNFRFTFLTDRPDDSSIWCTLSFGSVRQATINVEPRAVDHQNFSNAEILPTRWGCCLANFEADKEAPLYPNLQRQSAQYIMPTSGPRYHLRTQRTSDLFRGMIIFCYFSVRHGAAISMSVQIAVRGNGKA